MTSHERVRNLMHYKPVDKVPVQYYYCPVGYYEHGDKLNDLYAALPGDFEPFRRVTPRGPAPEELDAAGNYHTVHTDRAVTMTHGTPQQVRDLVLREYDTFRMPAGGSWFYIEADNGFPYENLEALVNTVRELRGE